MEWLRIVGGLTFASGFALEAKAAFLTMALWRELRQHLGIKGYTIEDKWLPWDIWKRDTIDRWPSLRKYRTRLITIEIVYGLPGGILCVVGFFCWLASFS